MLLVCTLCAYPVLACFVGSAVFTDLCGFVPGLMELSYAIAVASWMVVCIFALPQHQQ